MFVLIKANDRQRPSRSIEPGHSWAAVQIATQDPIWHIRAAVLRKDRMWIGRIDVRKPGRVATDGIDGLIAEQGLDRSRIRIEEPEPGSGRPLPGMVEINAFARVVHQGVRTIRSLERPVQAGGDVDDVDEPEVR